MLGREFYGRRRRKAQRQDDEAVETDDDEIVISAESDDSIIDLSDKSTREGKFGFNIDEVE